MRLLEVGLLGGFVSSCRALLIPHQPSFAPGGQKPLLESSDERIPSEFNDLPPFSRGSYSLREQDAGLCQTYGERQWTGTVDVSDGKRLFFWFFESRGSPETDPVILWMNGGPGGSSMMGLLTEMGPCWLDPGSSSTRPNPHSWNNNASLLFLEQPAGTGLSILAPEQPLPSTDAEGAVDFQRFLNTFFSEVMPSYADRELHIAGESYGGHYVPAYVRHIAESRSWQCPDAFSGHVVSIILVNALTDIVAASVGSYELLCTDFRGDVVQFNASVCASMAQHLPECMRLGDLCHTGGDGEVCMAAEAFCSEKVDRYYAAEKEAGRRSPYNIHLPCTNKPFCWDGTVGNHSTFLNQRHAIRALGYSPSFEYKGVNMDINAAFEKSRDVFQSTTGTVAALLDSWVSDDGSDLRVLVLNGNEDYIVNTPGQIWVYDNMRWSGQADFRTAKWHRWSQGAVGADFDGSGFWKQTKDSRLVFVGVDGAGHEVPRGQRAASWEIVQRWLGGWA